MGRPTAPHVLSYGMSKASESRDGMVLARYLALAGVGSRRANEGLIRAGRVLVNGEVCADVTRRVVPGRDRVACDGRDLDLEPKRYVLLHKPRGYTCSAADRHADKLALDLLADVPERLFSVGRLDRDSEGLLLFTNDGDWANRLTHPRYGVEKTYCVTVQGRVTPEALPAMLAGIEDDGELLRATVARVRTPRPDGAVLEIRVREGRKREIRRLCERVGLRVRRLLRTGFGPLELGTFAPGTWRDLTAAEVTRLKEAANSPCSDG